MLGSRFGVIVACIAVMSTKGDHSQKPSLTDCTAHVNRCNDNMLNAVIGGGITCGAIESFVECAFHSGCDVPESYQDKWQQLLQMMIDNQGLSCPFTLANLVDPKRNSFGVTRSKSTVLVWASTSLALLRTFFGLH
ncbi:unnamed protein product [Lymnaea stagnalis]|uniref:Uncharacterized protein n=1 Tax=Lymnaea stagnalis TaxID=6523 RepID=A0AAV2HDG0_LYMST